MDWEQSGKKAGRVLRRLWAGVTTQTMETENVERDKTRCLIDAEPQSLQVELLWVEPKRNQS